ncbi:MAG: hypothetical protein KC464_24705, partial [Myxococcales bacterium]|nr:hypothetical protein [Myxococcales bacterium]
TNPPYNATRADDISYIYSDAAVGTGDLVVFLASDAFGSSPVPLSGAVAGSEGLLCLELNYMQLGAAVPDASGTAALVFAIPAPLRSTLNGVSLVQQAIALDLTALVVRGAPCGRQLF